MGVVGSITGPRCWAVVHDEDVDVSRTAGIQSIDKYVIGSSESANLLSAKALSVGLGTFLGVHLTDNLVLPLLPPRSDIQIFARHFQSSNAIN